MARSVTSVGYLATIYIQPSDDNLCPSCVDRHLLLERVGRFDDLQMAIEFCNNKQWNLRDCCKLMQIHRCVRSEGKPSDTVLVWSEPEAFEELCFAVCDHVTIDVEHVLATALAWVGSATRDEPEQLKGKK